MDTSDTASIIDFTSYMTDLTRDFTGREWVFQSIQAWLADSHKPRFFLLTGDPGSGKSSIAARLAQFSQGSISSPVGCPLLAHNFISALHFCSARDSRWINPTVFAESLALQLGARYQLFAKALAEKREDRQISIEVTQRATNITGGQMVGVAIHKLDLSSLSAEDAFTRIVREPLEVLLGQEPEKQVIVMVDALDEALTYSGSINIVSLLAQVEYLPPGARFIITSRKVDQIKRAFRQTKSLFLSSQEFNEQNQEDIEHFVEGQLLRDEQLATKVNTLPPERVENLKAEVIKKATGNFLYVRFLLDAIAGGQRPLTQLEGLPEGLDGLYFDSLERVVKLGKRSWYEEYAPLMGVLSVVQESVTQIQLAALTGQSESNIWEYLGNVQQFLEQGVISVREGGKRYRLYHQSVVDFLNQQWIVVDHEEMRNPFYCSMTEWHRKVASRCELGGIISVWEDERHDLVEQGRREYARKYYITHLYLAQAWHRLFEVLDLLEYGKAKLRNDPSTHSYALDLDLGRQATTWEGWTIEEGIASLPRLWQYTLLRCSLTSRADRYPEEAFRLLILLGRKQEALGLTELLTDPAKQVRVLLQIAKQLQEQANQECEWHKVLMRVGEVARTLKGSFWQAWALCALDIALAQEQKWSEAQCVVGSIEDKSEQVRALNALSTALAKEQKWMQNELFHNRPNDSGQDEYWQAWALRDLGTIFAQAGQEKHAMQVWAQAERLIDTMQDHYWQAKALKELGIALAQAGQWTEAERLIGTIQERYWQTEALRDLGSALAQAEQEKHAMQVWAQAERLIDTIGDSYVQAMVLKELGTIFAQAGQEKHAMQVWAQAERLIDTIEDSYVQAMVLKELGSALAQAGQEEHAVQVWTQAERLIGTIEDNYRQATALRELGTIFAQAGQEEHAVQVWAQAEHLIDTIGDIYQQATALTELCSTLAQAGQEEHAVQVWTDVEQVIDTIGDLSRRGMVLSTLGIIFAQAGQEEHAVQVWAQAERLINTIWDSSGQAWALSDFGTTLAQAGQEEHAVQVWTQAEHVINTIGDNYRQATALRELSSTLAQAGQWTEAERLIGTIRDSSQQAEALRELGTIFAQAGQEEHAMQVWAQAERVIGTIQNPYMKSWDLRELSSTLAEAGQWTEAERLIGTIRDRSEKARALSAVGTILAQAGQWTEAERLIGTIRDRSKRAWALSALGTALAEAGQEEHAVQVWTHAKHLIGMIRDRSIQTIPLRALGIALARAGQWMEAERVIDTIGDISEEAEALRELSAALVQAGQWAEAERVIDTIWDSSEKARALRELGTVLAQVGQEKHAVQVWTQAERVIGTIQDRYLGAQALRELGAAMVNADEFEQLLCVIQRSWRQVKTREEALSLFSLAKAFISRKPKMGITFLDAFTKVDTFVGR
ncbi:MAG: AAA family ATPase [Ktedonobacteraceae bacterium]